MEPTIFASQEKRIFLLLVVCLGWLARGNFASEILRRKLVEELEEGDAFLGSHHGGSNPYVMQHKSFGKPG